MNMTKPNISPSDIEQKVANILTYTQNYGHAAAKQSDAEKIGSLLRFAENFALSGNYESALIQIQRAYKVNPSNPNITILERKIHEMRKDVSSSVKETIDRIEASKLVDVVHPFLFSLKEYSAKLGLENERKEIQELLCRAEYYREIRDYAHARIILSQAFEIDPLNDTIILFEQRLFSQIAENDDDGVNQIILQAKKQLKEKNYEEALTLIKKAYLRDPLNDKIVSLEEVIRLELKKDLTSVEKCLLAAHRFFNENEFMKAKEEICLGYLLDPLNEQLSKLAEKINLAQQRN